MIVHKAMVIRATTQIIVTAKNSLYCKASLPGYITPYIETWKTECIAALPPSRTIVNLFLPASRAGLVV